MIDTTSEIIRGALGGNHLPRLESASLRLQKFVTLGHATKAAEIASVVACHKKHRAEMPAANKPPPAASVVVAQLAGRLIVNQAGGILENAGLCLHPHFGHPMVPGSAVKGVASHTAWCEWTEVSERTERGRVALETAAVFGFPTGHSDLDSELVETHPEVFVNPHTGTRAAFKGMVAFLAGEPVDSGRVELVEDIVNCHHPTYYRGATSRAADDEDPIPNSFPAVEAGAEFAFPLLRLSGAGHSRLRSLLVKDFDAASRAKQWLVEGLTIVGIGAKTAAGYGWFDYDEQAEKERDKQARLAREKAAQEEAKKNERRQRLAAMSDDERRAFEYWESLVQPEAEFKGSLAKIDSCNPDEQRILLTLCLKEGRDIWLAERKEYDRLRDKPKKQNKSKSFKRVGKILAVAREQGVELP